MHLKGHISAVPRLAMGVAQFAPINLNRLLISPRVNFQHEVRRARACEHDSCVAPQLFGGICISTNRVF